MTNLSRLTTPALDYTNGLIQKLQDLPASGCWPALQQRLKMREKRFMCVPVQLATLGCDSDMKTATVSRVIDALDQVAFFQLVDNAGHRAEPDVEICG